MVTAPELYALQETDQALDKAQSRLAEIEAELVEGDEMVLAREVAHEKRGAVDELRSRLSDAEWSVDEVRSKAAEVERKLYGGTVTNPKELADLDTDLKSLKRQIAKREDLLLGLLVEMEEAEAQLASAKGRYADIEADWKQECANAMLGRRWPEWNEGCARAAGSRCPYRSCRRSGAG